MFLKGTFFITNKSLHKNNEVPFSYMYIYLVQLYFLNARVLRSTPLTLEPPPQQPFCVFFSHGTLGLGLDERCPKSGITIRIRSMRGQVLFLPLFSSSCVTFAGHFHKKSVTPQIWGEMMKRVQKEKETPLIGGDGISRWALITRIISQEKKMRWSN